jgi:hypothetical protein
MLARRLIRVSQPSIVVPDREIDSLGSRTEKLHVWREHQVGNGYAVARDEWRVAFEARELVDADTGIGESFRDVRLVRGRFQNNCDNKRSAVIPPPIVGNTYQSTMPTIWFIRATARGSGGCDGPQNEASPDRQSGLTVS